MSKENGMSYEQVAEFLLHKDDIDISPEDYDVIIDVAVEALHCMPEYERLKAKDTAKKPTGVTGGHCPNCKSGDIGTYNPHFHTYCCVCGQKIEWTE